MKPRAANFRFESRYCGDLTLANSAIRARIVEVLLTFNITQICPESQPLGLGAPWLCVPSSESRVMTLSTKKTKTENSLEYLERGS